LTTQEYANTRNLFIFVGVLLAVGFLLARKITVALVAKDPKGKEYAPTVVLAIFLAGGIFLLDLLAPLGVAGAVPYVALVLVSLSLPHRKHTLAAATFASVLTALGFFFSPAGGTLWVVLANRGLALFAIWVTALLGLLHKQAEQAVRRSEASLAEAERIAHLGSWEWDIANNRAVWSEEAGRLFGFSPQQLATTHDHFVKSVHPDDWQFVEKAVNEALYEGKPYGVDYRIIRPDGAVRIVHSQGEVSFDQAGTPVRMTGTVQDITERMRAQEALRKQAQIIDQIHDSVVSTDLDGYVTSWNKGAERLFGYTAEEMLGKHIAEVYPPEEHAFLQNQVIAPLRQNGEHEVEVRMRRKSGKDFFAHLSLSLLRDGNGTPTGMIGYSMDITERKQAEENLRALATRLEQSNRELQSFASVAAHDLQEPLRKVLMFGDRLQAKCHQALTDQGRDFLDRMLNAAARMQTLIDDLLAFSRVTTQPQPFAPVDLNAVAREVLSDLEGRIAQESGQVEIGKLPTIEADRTQMRQLLQNLISNALKFHRKEEAPVVSIRGKLFNDRMQPLERNSPGDGLCQIIVEDNGIGFDQKYADRIFGIFQRLHGRQEFQGTGIGLALCRRIAERHGGSITAQSKPGQGTTFTVRLPIKQHQGEKVA
jgi:two-component system sensor kinase FixL